MKLQNLKKEFDDQIKDIKHRKDIYWLILGLLVYETITYLVLNIVPYVPLKIFTWCFFMLVFSVILILIEDAITFTQACHLAIIAMVQIMLSLRIQINPVTVVLIYEVLLRRYVLNLLFDKS